MYISVGLKVNANSSEVMVSDGERRKEQCLSSVRVGDNWRIFHSLII